MLVDNGNGGHTASSADLLCILKNVETGRFHVAFLEERPMPGSVQELRELEFFRLRSKMHHTTGTATLEEALAHLNDLRKKIEVPDDSVLKDPIDWDGTVGFTFIAANWLREKRAVRKEDLLR